MRPYYDVLIIVSGVSGSKIAQSLTAENGLSVGMLEAGTFFNEKTFPTYEADANTRLYWGGGMELTADGGLALLRARVVGGGSIVNQALVDRFDDVALDSWRDQTGISYLSTAGLSKYYDEAEGALSIQKIDAKHRNPNAQIFAEGCQKNGYGTASLRRAQSHCDYENGADCLDCLFGCRRKSKQSTVFTSLERAIKQGLELTDRTEVVSVALDKDWIRVSAVMGPAKTPAVFKTRKLVLAAGVLGNTKILAKSVEAKRIPRLGKNFYTHPQYMVMGVYDRPVEAFRGAFQTMKSEDPNFRKDGFKLENVFGPPVALSMLFSGFGKDHYQAMREISQMACIEVAVRDTNPGEVKVSSKGKISIQKELNEEDRRRRDRGLEVIQNIFQSTGVKRMIEGQLPIGLHLMGGCTIGSDEKTSVVNPDFQLWADPRVFVADSSIFPNAPGINPSLTIMALSFKAAENIKKELRV